MSNEIGAGPPFAEQGVPALPGAAVQPVLPLLFLPNLAVRLPVSQTVLSILAKVRANKYLGRIGYFSNPARRLPGARFVSDLGGNLVRLDHGGVRHPLYDFFPGATAEDTAAPCSGHSSRGAALSGRGQSGGAHRVGILGCTDSVSSLFLLRLHWSEWVARGGTRRVEPAGSGGPPRP